MNTHIKLGLFFVIFKISLSSPPQCGLYGAPPCQFIPAPPGSTPSCAGPGRTYCEHIDHYPIHVIKHLIEKWGYDIHNFITDETTDEFNSIRIITTTSPSFIGGGGVHHQHQHQPQFFGPSFLYGPPPTTTTIQTAAQQPTSSSSSSSPANNNIFQQDGNSGGYQYPVPINSLNYKSPVNQHNFATGIYNQAAYTQPIYISRPGDNILNNNNNNQINNNLYQQQAYQTAALANNYLSNQYQLQQLQQHQRLYQQQQKQYPQQNQKLQNFYLEPPQQITEYNQAQWLKRYSRDLTKKYKYPTSDVKIDISNNHNTTIISSSTSSKNDYSSIFLNKSVEKSKNRNKRQTTGRQTLCQVNTQYIQPQAALNSRGNWMYVVNQQDAATTQLVKTETCASNVCSNLCQLPNGYNSRCEQKYVQKRLVALNGNGQNLYTDTFWFPSCCVCTISNQ